MFVEGNSPEGTRRHSNVDSDVAATIIQRCLKGPVPVGKEATYDVNMLLIRRFSIDPVTGPGSAVYALGQYSCHLTCN